MAAKGKTPFVEVTTGDRALTDIQRNAKDTFAQLEELRRGLLAFAPKVVAGDYEIGEETFVVYTGPGGHSLTFPKADALGGKASAILVMNSGHGSTPNNTTGETFDFGAGGIALRASGSDAINDGPSFELGQGEMTIVMGDGAASWRTQTPIERGTINPSYMTIRTIDPTIGSGVAHFARRIASVFRPTANIAVNRAGIAEQIEYVCDAAGFAVASSWTGLRVIATETDLGGAVNYIVRFARTGGGGGDLFYVSGGATPECNIPTTKFGVLGAAPIVRQAAITSPAGGGTVDTQSRAAIDAIRAVLTGFGFTL